MIQRKSLLESLFKVVLYGFGGLLLWEWLQPVNQLTDTDNMGMFIVFMCLSLLTYFLRVHWVARILILMGYMTLAIQYLYSQLSLFDLAWIGELMGDMKLNISRIMEADWMLLTNSFRTWLFFILIWLISYLIHYWVTIRRNIFLFFLLTIVFLALLDTFTPYDADTSIIRVMIIGLVVLGLLAYFRLFEHEKLAVSMDGLRRWLIPLSIMVLASGTIGFAAPKLQPQWPDPVPFITSYANKSSGDSNGAGSKRVGYGENDTKLGGSISDDQTVVFYADASTRHYWKVENKSHYTGKGWTRLDNHGELTEYDNDQDIVNLTSAAALPGMRLQELKASVKMEQFYNHVPYPTPSILQRVSADDADQYMFNDSTNLLTAQSKSWGRLKLTDYEIDYFLTTFDRNYLRKVTSANNIPENIMNTYTQLPRNLPERIRNLAEKITSTQDNWYDKAKAIENHFDGPEFVYDKQDIPYPEERQDYVDQFLFETLRGYCDNFSTAMVVLLRSLDIPARWAKGYSDGVATIKNGESIYMITNNNAHSWVEVYFPEVGWVPFEPTKGFNNTNRFYDASVNTQANMNDHDAAITTPEKREPSQPVKKPLEEVDQTNQRTNSKSVDISWKVLLRNIAIGLGGVSILTFLFYQSRRKWLPYVFITRYKGKNSTDTFTNAYHVLLKQLNRAGVQRREGQTLREYAVYVDIVYSMANNNMLKLTEGYERFLYRGDQEKQVWKQYQELWENLIKETTS
ncbi:transglutaminase TgpA family protein [Bacillus cihuensis]|uniref:transglutaminase TgpA family protein n=1 Tax=Bacillus cihuensis TaxID=1208599 RepID=UPI000410F89D|nr:transglutaminase domain-containing protein [Bacillus cihuensis]